MTTAVIITTVALLLIVGGVVALVPGLLKLLLSTLGSAVAWLIKPIVKLFRRKGGDQADSKVKEPKSKAGVEEVVEPLVPAAAAA